MGDPIKAEKVAAHFATPASPALMATPFGSRSVPTVPAVNFEHALLTATRTFGNKAPLFLLRSIAIDPVSGKSFKPLEGLMQNPVEGSWSTSHGHGGLLFGPGFPPTGLPAAINAGILPGGLTRCSAEFQAVLLALAERMAREFKDSPLDVVRDFDAASREAGMRILGEEATGLMNWLKSVPGKVVSGFNWLAEKEAQAKRWAVGQAIRAGNYAISGEAWADVKHSAERAGDYVMSGRALADLESGAVSVAEATKAAYDYISNIPYQDVLNACLEAIKEILGDAGCSMVGALQAMLADPRSIATQLGEIHGTVKAHATIVAAETAATVAADILVSKGAATASSRVGIFIARTGGKVSEFADTIGSRVRAAYARRQSARPPAPPEPTRAPSPASGRQPASEAQSPDAPATQNKDGVNGNANGRSPINCLSCP